MKHFTLLLLVCICLSAQAQEKLTSPDGKLSVEITSNDMIHYQLSYDDEVLIETSDINLIVDDKHCITNRKIKVKRAHVDEEVEILLPLKNKVIRDDYNAIEFTISKQITLECRAYNDGFTYRFVSDASSQNIEVNEIADFTFAGDYHMWASPIDGFSSSYESSFPQMKISEMDAQQNTYLPILLDNKLGKKVLITEANVYDYPHMFLANGDQKNTLHATFPAYPLNTELIGDRQSKVLETANYIAKTTGSRAFPWRVFIVCDNDAVLVNSDLVTLLADKRTSNTDISWIKPGRVAWDWWNASNVYGVDFKSGYNTETWMAYIDFASKYGLEYVILDEGWSFSTMDITKAKPELDLPQLISYAKSNNVELILWTTWRALSEDITIIERYSQWGVSGIKVDFMDRSDQWMVNFIEEVSKETFKHKLTVDFHGAFKPTGMRHRYPNVLSYEGVFGLENCKWSSDVTPEHNLTLPFTRMVAGPMDYTPGAMRNFHSEEYVSNFNRPSSMGTRAHQVALFVVFESGIQMFADSPSNYYKEAETSEFIATIPVVWDETQVIEASIEEYILMARRSGSTWFVGALTGGKSKTFELDFSFLGEGEYTATVFKDGVNVDKFAEDFKIETIQVNKMTKRSFNAYKGSGFTIRLDKVE